MNSKNIQKEKSWNESLVRLNDYEICEVSKASAQIMLERFCNGKEIDFPFSQ